MNRLAEESSPYLRQHADNPVDWYPWGPEAFDRARTEDKPVLLSVGYSACHWCHVMAHESFENPATAAVMNALFVCIKVDREERPDVDAVYMDAVVAMSGSGGWPMTVFLTPDGQPFFGGTYFPPEARHGRPSFVELLRAVDDAWRHEREDMTAQADRLTEAMRTRSAVAPPSPEADLGVSIEVLHRTRDSLARLYDPERGGFGRAPKFPTPSNLELLLRDYAHTRDGETLRMVTITLDAMAAGGIYDHLGGGFARYSVDASWMVPHFEKMLYDNALLPRPYLEAWQLTGEARFAQVVSETLGYVLRDLTSPEGGFFSAEDADSEGVEGKFYVWQPDELTSVLEGAGLGDANGEVSDWYGVSDAGNFEGTNILYRPRGSDPTRPPRIEAARQALLDARGRRVRPGLDDKVVTEWNAMMIATLARAGAALDRPEWVEAAERGARFLNDHLLRGDGRWLRAWHTNGGTRHLAYALDYAHLVDAFTRLSEATGRAAWLAKAAEAADALLELFWDDLDGGLFTTGADAEALVVRTKDVFDGATPSANSYAAVALLRLAALTGVERYAAAADGILRLLHVHLRQQPTSVTVAVAAVDLVVSGCVEVVVAGTRPDLVQAVQRRYAPTAVLAWGEPSVSPLWTGRTQPAAYVCRNFTCRLPAETVEDLEQQLASADHGQPRMTNDLEMR